MDFLNGKIKTLYFKYLLSAFGSALITSIYSIVDMAMVGQYHGPEGTAALAVVAPVWNLIYSLGLLMGIGGSVLFGISRGRSDGQTRQSNEYFTASIIGSVILAAAAWVVIILFDRELLTFFGADASTLGLALDYMLPVKFVIPCFLFTQTLAAYLRNDKNPALATAAVLAGGVFNIFGDYFFVFVCDMGAMGAGLATAIGSVISIIVMLGHFFRKQNTLRFVRPTGLVKRFREIVVTGFSTFFIDIAMGVLTILFNRQILKYALGTAAAFGLIWTALCLAIPNQFIRIFMDPTESVLQIAPTIIRDYGISFLLLPLNIFSTYYFQAIMKPQAAFVVSLSRGLVISGLLILLLPAAAGAGTLWFAMPITEVLVAIYVIYMMVRYTKVVTIQPCISDSRS